MAINKLALIRYKTIDQCLCNRYRRWTLEDLIEKVSEALYEYEGIRDGVSKRTIQADLQLMRSDRLGYNAPIKVIDRKYYVYEDAAYSINHSPVTDADLEKMNEMVSVLQQMSGFDYFTEVNEILAKLENSLRKKTSTGQNLIQLETNRQLKGIEHITPLYHSILKKIPLLISYQSFRSDAPRQQVYHPYLLKEYRNRWFLICRARGAAQLVTLALDRIVEFLEMSPQDYEPYTGIDFERYYEDTIGVTKTEKDRARRVILWVNAANAPYVLTKPFHSSQQLLKKDEQGCIIRLDVVLNFELEREILGFGEAIKVMAPTALQTRIHRRLQAAEKQYG